MGRFGGSVAGWTRGLAAAAVLAPFALGGAARTVVAAPVDPAPAVAGAPVGPGPTVGAVPVDPARAVLAAPAGTPTAVFGFPSLPRAELEPPPRAGAPAPERRPAPALLVRVDRPLPVTARPGGGAVVGTVPAGSRFYGTPTVAWVLRVAQGGRYGLVQVPYDPRRTLGWIPLHGLRTERTRVSVRVDLSRHLLLVERAGRVVLRARAATGAPGSPTPPGRYFVTDRVAFPAGHVYGTFAFGLSGIQPRLPAGWSGGDQLAIHGTNEPWTIGRSVSAGCLRVSEPVLRRLRALLRLGTPVVIRR